MTEEATIEDWSKLDLRVAEIKKIEDIENADKLYKLTIDVGELGKRVICAGIKQHYSKEELKGKKIIIIANLQPRVMKGIESQGMLLAATTNNPEKSDDSQAHKTSKVLGHEKVVLIEPDKDIESGSKIS